MDGYFDKGVYYPPSKQPEEIEMVIRVKVEGMEELDVLLERVKAISEYASCVPAHMHIYNNITVNRRPQCSIQDYENRKCALIDGIVCNNDSCSPYSTSRVISPDQQRLEV